jgi:regulator of sigma E protease
MGILQFLLNFLLTLLLLDILVVIHEGGHFVFARLSGIKVNEFSVGMGPLIFQKVSKKSGISFSFRALPIGGYVAMEGEDGESEKNDAFCNRPLAGRIATVLAGPAMNVLLGFLCMFILVAAGPVPVSNVVAGFQEGAVSCEQGLQTGDRIVRVGGTRVHSGNELVYEITNKGYTTVDLTVERDGQTVELRIDFPKDEEEGISFGSYDFIMYADRKTVGTVFYHAFWRSCSTVKMIIDSLADLARGRYGLESVAGPVGIAGTVGAAASSSFSSLFYLFIVISINLGIMNLLPFPALDGGRLLLLIIEGVTGRRVPKKVEAAINGAGLILLMILALLITAKDIFKLFGQGGGR